MSGSSHSAVPSASPPAASASALSVRPVVDAADGAGDEYDFDAARLLPQTGFRDKLWAKMKKDPLVPIGLTATCAALCGGLAAMGRMDAVASQKFMKLRVGAQAFTLAAVVFAMATSGKLLPQPTTTAAAGGESTAAGTASRAQQQSAQPQPPR